MPKRTSFLLICLLIQINFPFHQSIIYQCSMNSTCGCSSKSAIVTKIVGGEPVEVDSWGWAISIRSKNRHICGGSLISSEFVVSAAHCFASEDSMLELSITAGSEHLSVVKQQRSISTIFVHRNYDSTTYTNDIAVLRLSSPLNLNDISLAAICLPRRTTENNVINIDVVAIGWGLLETHGLVRPDVLRQVTLKTVASSDSTCRRTLRNEKLQLCAGVAAGGKDTCQGDSGGPLMMFSKNQWYLIGITSYGKDCGLRGFAGVYTRVSAYEESINCLLENNTRCIEKAFLRKNVASSITASFCLNGFLMFFYSFI